MLKPFDSQKYQIPPNFELSKDITFTIELWGVEGHSWFEFVSRGLGNLVLAQIHMIEWSYGLEKQFLWFYMCLDDLSSNYRIGLSYLIYDSLHFGHVIDVLLVKGDM